MNTLPSPAHPPRFRVLVCALREPGNLFPALLPAVAGLLLPFALETDGFSVSTCANAFPSVLLAVLVWLLSAWSGVALGKQEPCIALRRAALAFVWCIAALPLWSLSHSGLPVEARLRTMAFSLGMLCLIACFTSLAMLAVPATPQGSAISALPRCTRTCLWLTLIFLTLLCHLSVSAISRHNQWLTFTSDLGIMDQTLWNTAHGRLLTFTIARGEPTFRPLSVHVEPMYIPLSLLYWIYSDPRTALFAQALFVAFGAIPLFLLAREKLKNEALALALCGVYFLHPAVQGVCMNSLHGNTLAIPFLLFAFYYMEKNEPRKFLMHCVLALMCREDVAFVVAFLGLFALWRKKLRVAVWASAASVAWVGIFLYLLPKLFNQAAGLAAERPPEEVFGHLKSGMAGMLKEMAAHPALFVHELFSVENAFYLFQLFAPLAFLSFLCPGILLTIAPALILHLVSGWVLMKNIHTQYPATFLPAIFVAAICGLRRLSMLSVRFSSRINPRHFHLGALLYLLLSGIFLHKMFGLPQIRKPFWDRQHIAAMEQSVKAVPPDASVAASQHLGPRLTQREQYYSIERPGNAEYIIHDTQEPFLWRRLSTKPQILLLDPYALPPMEDRNYGAIRNLDGVVTFQRGANVENGLRILFQTPVAHRQPITCAGDLNLLASRIQARQSWTGGFFEINLVWHLRRSTKSYPRYRLICRSPKDIRFWDRAPTFGRFPLALWTISKAICDRFYVRIDRKDFDGHYRFYVDHAPPPGTASGVLATVGGTACEIGTARLPL